MRPSDALAAAIVLALPTVSTAQPVEPIEGFYMGGNLGYNWSRDIRIKSLNVDGTTLYGNGAKLRGQGGFAALVSAGYGFHNNIRVELEANYLDNQTKLKNANLLGVIPLNGSAELDTFGLFVNAFYDFNGAGFFTPYLGAGLGYQWTAVSSGRAYAAADPGAGSITINNTAQGSLAAQAILGVASPTGVPGLTATA